MEVSRLIADRPVADIIACNVDTSVREAVRLLAEKKIGALPITAGGRVVGIFSERDVVYRLAEEGASCLDHPVGEVMTSPPITVDTTTNTLEALALMTRRRIRHLPVVENGEFCGFLSIGDLVKSRLEEIQHEAEAMRMYIQTA